MRRRRLPAPACSRPRPEHTNNLTPPQGPVDYITTTRDAHHCRTMPRADVLGEAWRRLGECIAAGC